MTARVFVVDDHELFRSGVRSELGRDLEIVGDAGSVEEAVPAILSSEPDQSPIRTLNTNGWPATRWSSRQDVWKRQLGRWPR